MLSKSERKMSSARLRPALARVAHHQRHILDLSKSRHRAVPRQAQQQVRSRVVLRDLEHHAAVGAVPRHEVLRVDEVCAHRVCVCDTPGVFTISDMG